HPHAWAGGADELPPPPAYPRPRLPAHRRQPVVPPPALAGALHPAPGDEALVLEAAQDGGERCDPESQLAARRALDLLADLVAVARPSFEERQHEHFRAALLELAAEHDV